MRHDIEYLKKGKRPPKQQKVDLNQSVMNLSALD